MEIIGGGRYCLKKKKKTPCEGSCSVTFSVIENGTDEQVFRILE